MLNISEIRAAHQINPVGLSAAPRFSWKLQSGKRGVLQTGYHLQIALRPGFERPLWDKQTNSGQSAHVAAEGFEVQPLTAYYWRVRVQDNHGRDSGWSETGRFVTALTDAGQWQAPFITAETPADAATSKATMMRGEFTVEKPLAAAYVLCSALGLYHLHLNGEKVGDDQLAPGWTSYHKHLLYQTHDVTTLLKPGRHALGAMVGAGWYKGLMGFLGSRNNYGAQTAFACQLHLVYQDGTTQTVCTGPGWRCADAPVTFAEIYDGEVYDARLEQPGWCAAGFDDATWRPAAVLKADTSVLCAQAGGRIKCHEVFTPKAVLTTPQGDTVIDFGQNLTGWPRIHAHGAPGEVIELACFETLDAEGNVYTDNLRSAKQSLRYICKGEDGWYQPLFTFYGFRYVHVKTWPGAVRAQDFCSVAVYSDMAETGSFACSNPDLNQLQSNIRWSMKSNFLDVPTDCPQRNERMGWTGDAQIFCRTAAYLMDVLGFYRKWLQDVAADQTPEGGVPHVVPDIITGQNAEDDWLIDQGTHSAAAWADVIVLNPWNLYLAYGDAAILRQFYAPMKKWIDFMRAHADGVVWNYRLQFGDWVALDAEEGSYFGATPNDLSCTAYYAYSTGVFAKIAEVLGKDEDAREYAALCEEIKAGFQRLFFTPGGEMTVQTQTAHILALYFGLVPDAFLDKTAAALLRLLEKEDGHLVTGFMGTPYFTHALSQSGHVKEAYALLLKTDFPSWLYQVRRGATTIWEHWDGLKPDGSMWSADMNSFNHYAYGAVGDWMYRVVAGINNTEDAPGYRHSLLCPRPGGGLSYAEGSLETVYGLLSCRWEVQDDGSVQVRAAVTPNTQCTLALPDALAMADTDGLRFEPRDGVLTAQAGSGVYTLRFWPVAADALKK